MSQYTTKICNTCQVQKKLDEFVKDKKSKNGYSNKCLTCYRLYQKEWATNNQLRLKKYKQQHYIEHKEKYQASNKKFLENNRQHRVAYSAKWKKDNRDKMRTYDHTRRTKKAESSGSYMKEEFEALIELYDYRCYWCGCDLKDTQVQADHFVPISKGGNNYIQNIVPSCVKCNLSKGAKMPSEFRNGETDKPKCLTNR